MSVKILFYFSHFLLNIIFHIFDKKPSEDQLIK